MKKTEKIIFIEAPEKCKPITIKQYEETVKKFYKAIDESIPKTAKRKWNKMLESFGVIVRRKNAKKHRTKILSSTNDRNRKK